MVSLKSTLLLLSTLLTSTTFAAPTAAPTAPVSITLIDAVGHEWPIAFPADQSWVLTNVKESISHVRISNQGDVPCAFFGVDGVVVVEMPGEVRDSDVGPPQTIVGGRCGPWGVHA